MSPEKEQSTQYEIVPYPFTREGANRLVTIGLPDHFIPSSVEKKLTPEQKKLLPYIEKYIRSIVGTINEILENMRAIECMKKNVQKNTQPVSILPIHRLTYLVQCALEEAPCTRSLIKSEIPSSFEWKNSFLESYKQFSKQFRFVQLVFLAWFIKRTCNIPVSMLLNVENANTDIFHAAGKDLEPTTKSIQEFQNNVQTIRDLLKDVHFSLEEK